LTRGKTYKPGEMLEQKKTQEGRTAWSQNKTRRNGMDSRGGRGSNHTHKKITINFWVGRKKNSRKQKGGTRVSQESKKTQSFLKGKGDTYVRGRGRRTLRYGLNKRGGESDWKRLAKKKRLERNERDRESLNADPSETWDR